VSYGYGREIEWFHYKIKNSPFFPIWETRRDITGILLADLRDPHQWATATSEAATERRMKRMKIIFKKNTKKVKVFLFACVWKIEGHARWMPITYCFSV
jgi:hypothetical protein